MISLKTKISNWKLMWEVIDYYIKLHHDRYVYSLFAWLSWSVINFKYRGPYMITKLITTSWIFVTTSWIFVTTSWIFVTTSWDFIMTHWVFVTTSPGGPGFLRFHYDALSFHYDIVRFRYDVMNFPYDVLKVSLLIVWCDLIKRRFSSERRPVLATNRRVLYTKTYTVYEYGILPGGFPVQLGIEIVYI